MLLPYLFQTQTAHFGVGKRNNCFKAKPYLKLQLILSLSIGATSVRMFTCKKLRYIWNIETKEFLKVKSLGPGMPTSSLHHAEAQQGLAGLSLLEQQRRYRI